MSKNVCCEHRILQKRGLVETAWFSSILVVISRPIFGQLSHILSIGLSFVINRIGCILAAVIFVNHPLLSI